MQNRNLLSKDPILCLSYTMNNVRGGKDITVLRDQETRPGGDLRFRLAINISYNLYVEYCFFISFIN